MYYILYNVILSKCCLIEQNFHYNFLKIEFTLRYIAIIWINNIERI